MRFRLLPLLMTALTSPAVAADMIYEEPVPAPSVGSPAIEPVPTYDWGGFHLGIDGGYGFAELDLPEEGLPFQFPDTAKGAFGGVFVGYDYEFPDWTLGVEADMQLAKIKEEYSFLNPQDNTILSLEFGPKWFGSARLRVGTTGNRFHPYVTGGMAFGKIDVSQPITGKSSKTKTGYSLGAGVEYALRKRLIGRLEYQYLDFGEFKYSYNGVSGEIPFKMHTVRVGLGLKF